MPSYVLLCPPMPFYIFLGLLFISFLPCVLMCFYVSNLYPSSESCPLCISMFSCPPMSFYIFLSLSMSSPVFLYPPMSSFHVFLPVSSFVFLSLHSRGQVGLTPLCCAGFGCSSQPFEGPGGYCYIAFMIVQPFCKLFTITTAFADLPGRSRPYWRWCLP